MTQITKEAISRAIRDPGVTEGYKGDRTRSEWQTDAVMRVLSTLPIAGEGKVKQLEWSTISFGDEIADSILGTYTITGGETYFVWFAGQSDSEDYAVAAPTMEAAKAAAQSDYETRILSALICSPGKDGGQEVEAVTCERCQGNGEIVTDWERYKHPHDGDAGDEAVAECPDCNGEGRIDTQAASTALVERLTKALEWRLNEEGWQIADTFFGGYRVERNPHDHWCWGVFFHGGKGVGLNPADNFEAAKAAAQADFNERISSSLEAKPAPDFRDLIIVGDTAYPVHSEVCRAFNELRAALSVPAEAVVGEPVAWTTQAQIDKFKVDPGCNAVMWGEPLPHHPDIPLYAAPSAPEGGADE